MIQKILGCLNYSHDFIKNLAKERHKLYKLLPKKNQTGWSEKHKTIAKKLKDICFNLPKLILPNENDNLFVTPQISGVIFFFIQEFNVQLFYIPKYMKLYCFNIFYKKVSQGHNPTFVILSTSKERRLLVYLKGGYHDGVSKAQ